MYRNAETRPVETILGRQGGGIKENDGVSECKYDIYKNFCKCHNVIQDNNNKKNACLV
jgi:hypothetical protein